MPTEAQIQALADYKASYLPSEVGANSAFRSAIDEHVRALERLAEPETCVRRKVALGSELDADNFRERVVLSEGAEAVVAGIRFQNRDAAFPFVEINATFDLFEPERIEHVAAVAGEHFARFAPRGILVAGPPDLKLPIVFERWTHAVGGPAVAARDAPLPPALTCSFPAAIDFYAVYCAAYAAWQASSPGLSGFVRPEPRADLEAAAAAGLLASFADPAGWSGVVAAREEAFYGTPAMYIFEILLVERWRGRGAAVAIDGALVSRLAGRYPFVWEHIHSENWPSLRVAEAQGRSILETDYFFPLGEGGRWRNPPDMTTARSDALP